MIVRVIKIIDGAMVTSYFLAFFLIRKLNQINKTIHLAKNSPNFGGFGSKYIFIPTAEEARAALRQNEMLSR